MPKLLTLWFAFLVAVAAASFASAQTYGNVELLDRTGYRPGTDTAPHLVTDGAGTWVVVWQSTDDLDGTIGGWNILFSRSTDGGVTWSFPAPLNVDAATDSATDWYPRLATDGAGTWLCVWMSTAGPTGSDGDIVASRSTDGGVTWTPAVHVNSNAASDSSIATDSLPAITTDGNGNWVVVWAYQMNNDYDVFVSRSTDAGATWSAQARLDVAVASRLDSRPDITTDRAGHWLAVWMSRDHLGDPFGTDNDIFFARSVNGGLTWTPPAPLNSDAASGGPFDVAPIVATDGHGIWLATWNSRLDTFSSDDDVFFSRSLDNGVTWSARAPLNSNAGTDSGHDQFPKPVTDGAGHWIAAWFSYDTLGGTIGSDLDVLYARSTDEGQTWTAPAPLNSNAATDPNGDAIGGIATDANGNWIAFWEMSPPYAENSDSDIFQARSTNNGGTWTAMAPLNANATDFVGEDVDPAVATDGADWIAVWSADDGALGGSDPDIVFSRTLDAGKNWALPAVVDDGAPTDAGADTEPDIATDAAGSWVAVWTSGAEPGSGLGTDQDVMAARSTDGGTTWASPVVVNSNAAYDSGDDSQAAIVADPAGHWVAVWTSRDSLGSSIGTDADILVARSSDAGASWTSVAPLGTNAASDTGDDEHAALVTDAAGTWLAAWQSTDSLAGTIGSDHDILVARSSDAGATWTPPLPLNGNAAIDSGADTTPHLATDGRGTWIAVWSSTDSLGGTIGSDADILVARSTDAGATWSSPEALRGDAASDVDSEFAPRITTDGAGNWNVAWYRERPYEDFPEYFEREIVISRSHDAGETWSAPELQPVGVGRETKPQLVTDRVGNWLMVFVNSYAPSSGSILGSGDADIYQSRGTGPDADGDALSDGAEVNLHATDPHDVDTDNDKLSDGKEVQIHHTDPLDPDSDDDGVGDITEVVLGFDPNDPGSTPVLEVPALGSAGRLVALGLMMIIGLRATSRCPRR